MQTKHCGSVAVDEGTPILFWFTVIHSMSLFFTAINFYDDDVHICNYHLRCCSPFWLNWSLKILKQAKY